MTSAVQTRSEPRSAWLMVAVAAAFTGIGTGSLGSFAVFLKPLSTEFGWLRGETTFAYMAGAAALGAGGLVMGVSADRFGTRPVVLFGALLLGLSCLLLSTQERLWQLYAYYVLLAGLGSSAFDAPLLANVGAWFDRNKGLALGLTTAGRALGQGLVPFAVGVMIPQFGWRAAYMSLDAFALAVMLPLALLVRNAPKRAPLPAAAARPAGAAQPAQDAQATRWVVHWLAFAAIFCCVCMSTAMVHVAALAQDKGIPVDQAAGIVLVIFVAGFFGRIVFGHLADGIGGLRTYMLASLSQSLLLFWFTRAQTLSQFYAVAVLFGFGFSGVMTCVVICVREYAPPARAGSLQGLVLFLAWMGMGIGAWQAGTLFDLTGSYTAPFAYATVSGFVNLAILCVIYARLLRQRGLPVLRWSPA